MKNITLPTGEYLMVEAQEDAESVRIENWISGETLLITLPEDELGEQEFYQPLPPGQWEIIGRASELSEEQWSGIVEPIGGWSSVLYYDYSASGRDYRDIIESGLKSPTKSGISLIKSHSMNPSTTLVIRKPVKQ